MGKLIKIVLSIIVIILIAGLSFVAGSYKTSQNPLSDMQANTAGGQRQPLSNANMVLGEVTAQNNQEITIKLNDGSTKTIILSGNTRIGKVISATVSDITIGASIMVNGSENSDGSINAQVLQIRQQAPTGQRPPRRQGN